MYRGPHSRDALATLLWPESSSGQSKKYLRQALWHLQTALVQNLKQALQVNSAWVSLAAEADIWLDVRVFEITSARAQGVQGRDFSAAQAEELRQAAGLYSGDFRQGCYEDWSVCERERLQNLHLGLLDKLAGYCEAHGEHEAGIDYCMRILSIDPARERAHRQLMRLHYLAGDRTAALRQYQRCLDALKQELGVGPSKSTQALYTQIREDSLGGQDETAADPASASQSSSPSLAEALDNLKRISTYLDDAQRRVNDQIRAAERNLSYEA
jgi:DNA-binding SARP family transcriptional activator